MNGNNIIPYTYKERIKLYEGGSKNKVRSPVGENFFTRIQRYTQHSKALVHTTFPHCHNGCQIICSIVTPTYRNRHRRNQRQGFGAT